MTTATRMTAEEFFAVRGERKSMQLIGGELVVDEPRLEHAVAQANLITDLVNWTREEPGRGAAVPPVDVMIDDHNVFAPDVAWLREARVSELRAPLRPPPDLVVEVRSPSTWRYDIGKKRIAYERAGLPELWLVDTVAESVLVFRRSSDRREDFDIELEVTDPDELTSPLLPGFSVPVERIFRR